MNNNSRGENILVKFEMQEMELRDLRTEVTNLNEIIKVKNEENAKLKTTLKSQEIMLNSVKEIVEKCRNQVWEVVSEQSTSRVLSESEPSNSTLNAIKEDMTLGSSSPCLPSPSSVSLKSPPITPVIVSSYSMPPMRSKVPPADRSTSFSSEAGNQSDGKHTNEDPWSDRVSRDWPMIDVNGHSVSKKQNVSSLGNYEGNKNNKKICVKFKIARSNLLDIGPLTTDGSVKSPKRVQRNKRLKENESEELIDVEYEVDRIIAYKVELGKYWTTRLFKTWKGRS